MKTNPTLGPMIQVRRIEHYGKVRIGLFFSYNQEIIQKIKSLKESFYSKTKNCWHLPYTPKAFQSFLKLELKHEIDPKSKSRENNYTSTDIIGTSGEAPPIRIVSNIEEKTSSISADATTEQQVAAGIFSLENEKIKVVFSNNHFRIETPFQDQVVHLIKGLHRSWWSKVIVG